MAVYPIFTLTKNNTDFRKEIITGPFSQTVIMNLKPNEEIGMETHNGDQTLIILQGNGKAILDTIQFNLQEGDLILVPKGVEHNIMNIGHDNLKLFTIYAPPQHRPGTVHRTKTDAEKEEKY